MGVPFADIKSRNIRDGWRLCAIAHCFHCSSFSEIRSIFDNIPGRVDVFLSTDTIEKASLLNSHFHDWDKGTVNIKIILNIGRDLTSKFIAFDDVLDSYDLSLFVHTKQDDGLIDANAWRRYLFHNLSGSVDICSSIIRAFQDNSDLGLVFPNHWTPARPWIKYMKNYSIMKELAAQMSFKINRFARLDFPSGSMFWARPQALRSIRDLKLQITHFPKEPVPKDGTLLHALERLALHSCEQSGFKWLKVVDPQLALRTDKVAMITNNDDVRAVIARTPPVLRPSFKNIALGFVIGRS